MKPKLSIIILLFLLCSCSEKIFSQKDTSITTNKLFFGISEFFVSKYIPKSGTQIGQGSANQFLAYINYSKFNVYMWLNYGFPDNRITETDLAIFYNFKISDNFLKGKLTGNIGFVEWIFPVWKLQNEIIESNLKYQGWINSNLLITQMLADQDVDFGTRLHLQFSKPIKISILKIETILTPIITSAYHFSFYEMNGLAFIAPGLEYTLKFNHLKLSAYLNSQSSTKNINVEKSNFLYSGIGIMLDF